MVHSQLNTYTTQGKREGQRYFLISSGLPGQRTDDVPGDISGQSRQLRIYTFSSHICMHTAHSRAASPPAPPPAHAGLDGKTENIFEKWKCESVS